MQKRIWNLFGLLALALPAALQMIAGPRPGVAVQATSEAYRRAVLGQDAAAVGATYARDAVEMGPGRPALEGRAAIQKYYEEMFRLGTVNDFTFSHLVTETAGALGYATGGYKRRFVVRAGPVVEDSGNFVVIVRREGNAWKSAFVIYNSDRSASPRGAMGPGFISPFPGLFASYGAMASRWLGVFASIAAVGACLGAIASLTRRVTRPASKLQ